MDRLNSLRDIRVIICGVPPANRNITSQICKESDGCCDEIVAKIVEEALPDMDIPEVLFS